MGPMIFLNPPDGHQTRRFGGLRWTLNRGGRRKARRNPTMARRKRKQSAKQRAASIRNLKKGRKARRAGKRSGGKRRKSRKGRRRAATFGLHRPRVRRTKSGWSSRGMLHGVKVNPPLIPSLGSVKSIVTDGASAAFGYVGVNAIVLVANRFGFGRLLAGKSPVVQALGDTALRVLSVPVVSWLGGMVFRSPNARRLITVGASLNAAYNGIKNVGGASGALASVPYANELLLGGGTGDYLMGSYVESLPSSAQESNGAAPAALPDSSDIYA